MAGIAKKKKRRLKLSKAWSECSVPLRFVGLGDKVRVRLLQEVWGLYLYPPGQETLPASQKKLP